MEFIIHPYEGVEIPGKGLIRFGMSREEVRGFFEEKPSEFYKMSNDIFPTDAFDKTGVHIYYEAPGTLIGFDFYSPSELKIKGISLLSIPFTQAKELLTQLNEGMLVNSLGSWDAKSLGVSLYESLEESEWNTEPVEGVSVIKPKI
jgi:hypothetical protein